MAGRKGNDNDRYVVPNEDRGGWDVVKEDHRRASAHTDTKAQALDRGRQIVHKVLVAESFGLPTSRARSSTATPSSRATNRADATPK